MRSPNTARTRAALLLVIALTIVSAAALLADDGKKPLPPPAGRQVDFAKDVQPIFVRHCYACHAGDKQESNFRLDNSKSAFAGGDLGEKPIIVRKSADSPLVRYVAGVDDALVMPPKGPKLTPGEVGIVRAWIDQGASWPESAESSSRPSTKHWSFQPLQEVAVPIVKLPDGANSIDAFVAEKLGAAGLSLSPEADRATLIRRLNLDMLGLPPSPEEIDAFVRDPNADAYDKLVERVLASPRYGERWARHWLDVVRFAETNGFETNVERPNAWHYRDYVIDALNSDKPYNQFVVEQIAGDVTGADAATGFLVGGPFDQVKSPDPVLTAMQRADELSDITNTTATTFLGLTVGCARCHNHKFDPILQKDYYALQAFFAGVQHGERSLARAKSPEHEMDLQRKRQRLASVREELESLRASTKRGRTILLDDEAIGQEDSGREVTLLAEKAGHGVNPDGTERGRKRDEGDFDRLPNVSQGRYTWWHNKPGQDVFSYRPAVAGRHHVWLSWGSGFATHTTDAEYWLDRDGDLKTTSDQKLVARIDQQQFAGDKQPLASQPLWSGFLAAGTHDFEERSVILLRGGKNGTAITADVIAFEEVDEAQTAEEVSGQPALREAVNSRENVERFAPVAARYIRFTAHATNSGLEPCLDEFEVFTSPREGSASRNIALATAGTKLTSSGNYEGNPIHRLEHLNDGKYGNSFSWISNTLGKGWVELELKEAVTVDRIVWGRDREEKYRDRTPTQYVIEVASELGKWQIVASSADRLPPGPDQSPGIQAFFGFTAKDAARGKSLVAELRALDESLKAYSQTQMVYAGRFEKPVETRRLFRGDPMQPKEIVAPDCLAVLGTLGLSQDTPDQQRRLALAKWIAHHDNPLTARVMVNRVWQHHFGAGLVDTPSDFGVNGAKPSHPELLDWLANQFIEKGWSVKALHRLILTSHTYRQANQTNASAVEADAQCRLLWRYPSRRLEAETIRDAILATSGALDLRMGGPGWSAFEPNSNYVRVYEPKDTFGPEEWRRAIYMTKVRMRQDGVFGAFDCPDAGQIAPKRARSTTALQALSLFNSQFIVQQADLFAKRIERDAGGDREAQVTRAFQLAFGRAPDEADAAAAEKLVAQYGLPALCRALFNANEFLFLP